jgi:PAS domain S-box-containing protein
MATSLYFTVLLLTCAEAGFLAFTAWRRRQDPGSLPFAELSLGLFLLALLEILSMLGSTQAQALFFFKLRFLSLAAIPVFLLLFALEYSGRKAWHSKRLVFGLFVIPLLTQIMVWSGGTGFWVRREVAFHRFGPFWLADPSARLPGLGFLVHSVFAMILMLASIALLLDTARRVWRPHRRQALLMAAASLVAFVVAAFSTFNWLPRIGFNIFTPGLGLSCGLVALAVLRFDFLKSSPTPKAGAAANRIDEHTGRALAVFLLVFALMAAGIISLGFLFFRDYKDHFRVQAEDQLRAINRMKITKLTEWRQERLGDARIFAQNQAFAALVERFLARPADIQARTRLEAWLGSYQTYGQYDRLFLVDIRGQQRISAPAAPAEYAEHMEKDTRTALSSRQVVFLDFHKHRTGAPIHLALLVPVFSPGPGRAAGRPLAVLAMRIDPYKNLYPFIQEWPGPSASAETLLVRRDGNDVLFLNDLRFSRDAALNLRIPMSRIDMPAVRAVLGVEGIMEGLDYRGVKVLAAAGPIPDSPWFMVARIDAKEVFAPIQTRLWQTLIFFGALLAVAGTGLGYLWRRQRIRYVRGQAAADKALQESEIRYRGLLESAPVGIAVHSGGRIVFVNPAGVRLLGAESEDQIIGRPIAQIIHPDGLPAADERIERMMAGEGGLYSAEDVYVRLDGTPVDVEVMAMPLSYQGRPAGQVIFTDITDRKRREAEIAAVQAELRRLLEESDKSRRALLSVVEDQTRAEEGLQVLNADLDRRVRERTAELAAANQELEAFAYSVSHDLRAPLRALDGFSAALASHLGESLEDTGRHFLDRIREAARRMGQLINDLLDLSRITRREMTRQSIDLSRMAGEIEADLRKGDPARPAEFVIDPGLTAEGDPALLRIALENLLANAWKFTGPRSPARIEVGAFPPPDGPGRIFYVRDNGVGFDMAYADKLFSPFQRLHSQKEFPGTGIGLVTVQRVITRHGGRIWAEAAVGTGVSFYFTLGGVP